MSLLDKDQDDVPLQEVLYKPTTQDKGETRTWFLYLAASIANLIGFACGIAFGWTSPVLPKLKDNLGNPLGRPITQAEESWIAGMLCMGAMVGPFVAGPIADKIGRKRTLLLTACPMVASFILAAFSTTVPLFYIARVLVGFGVGSTFTVLPMYLGEIGEDHNRGTLGCLMGVFVSSGLLFSFLVGPFLTITKFNLVCVAPLAIFLPVFLVWIPETPPFLGSMGKREALEASLVKLRGRTVREVQEELSQLMMGDEQGKAGVGDLVKTKGLRKALTIVLGLVILQQFAGISAVLAYMQTIFDATGSGMAPEISTIIVGMVQTVTTIVTSSLVDRLGRRILLLASSMGSCVALVGLGAYFYFKTNGFEIGWIFWMPVASLLLFIVSFNVGLGILPWTLMAELFPSEVRSVASTLTNFFCFLSGFVITLFFPSLSMVLGMALSFWSFALVCFAASVFVYCMLPETKGKSLQQIQKMLEGVKT